MTNPLIEFKSAYPTEAEARAEWSNLLDNDNYKIQGIVIDFMKSPANKPVAWTIEEKDLSD